MRKIILDLIIAGFLILITPNTIHAQLFETNELYPNTNVKKGKYYNGSGGGGYWSLEYVDPSPFGFLPLFPYTTSQAIPYPTIYVSEFALNTCPCSP